MVLPNEPIGIEQNSRKWYRTQKDNKNLTQT